MHIIKYKNLTKGILVITHKEFNYIIQKIINNRINEDYYIFLHIGWNVNIPRNSIISNYLVPNSRITTENDIPFTTRAFIPEHFHICTQFKENNIELLDYISQKKINGLSEFLLNINYNDIKSYLFDFIYVSNCTHYKNSI